MLHNSPTAVLSRALLLIATFATNGSALQLNATSRERLPRTYSAPPVIVTMQRPDLTVATSADGSSPKCVADFERRTPVAYPIAKKEGWRALDGELAATLAETSDSETEYHSGESAGDSEAECCSEHYSSCDELDREGERIVAEAEARDAEKLRAARDAEKARLRALAKERGARYEEAARQERAVRAEYRKLRATDSDFDAQEELTALAERDLEVHGSNLRRDPRQVRVLAHHEKDSWLYCTPGLSTNRTNGASLRNVMHDASAMRLTGWKAAAGKAVQDPKALGPVKQLPQGGSWRHTASKGDDLRKSLLRRKFSAYEHPVTRAKLFVKQGGDGRAAEHIVRFAGRGSRN